ncbi:MAG: hypothetical protein ACSHX7_13325 [Luteolibacter sp.]
MKTKATYLLGALLSAILISSCAQKGSPIVGNASPAAADLTRKSAAPEMVAPKRPGLATGWGDQKSSRIDFASFTRANSKPYGTDIIYYNDPEGIKAMVGAPHKIGALQTAAGNTVEWGIKGGFSYLPTYKQYAVGGNGSRRLVSGKKGSTYSIVIKNRCKSPLEIVASVDGLDVQDGKAASFSKRGYIVAPGDTLEIEGFRKSNSKVAAFEFSSVSNSYANLKHGDTRNVGVIGIAVFAQKGVDPWKTGEERLRGNARAFAEAP